MRLGIVLIGMNIFWLVVARNSVLPPSLSMAGKPDLRHEHLANTIGSAVALNPGQPDILKKLAWFSKKEDKAVLVVFWAANCLPCRTAGPGWIQASKGFKSRGIRIFNVLTDGEQAKAKWLQAIRMDGLMWMQVPGLNGSRNDAAAAYGVTGFPQNFLAGPEDAILVKSPSWR